MLDGPFNVLFVCTGNSARSILAESIANHWGRGHLRSFSAGSMPKGAVHPFAIDLLRSEVSRNMALMGVLRPDELDPSHLIPAQGH